MKFHTSLPVHDIQKTVEFYSALLEVAPVKLRDDYAKFLPDTLDLNITFHRVATSQTLQTDLHLGFQLPDQAALDRAFARLDALGLVSEQRSTSVCCYANQDKFWVTDPNGYRWEFYSIVNDATYKMDKRDACCVGSNDEQPPCCG